MSSRGEQLRVEGKFAEAEPLLRSAVYKAETLFGRYDSACVDPLWRLIQLLNEQGRSEEALEFNRRLFDVVRRGNLSPAWAADLSDWYGGALFQLGRNPEAEAALAEAVAIQERAGATGTKYEACIRKLTILCDLAGRHDDADRWRARVAAKQSDKPVMKLPDRDERRALQAFLKNYQPKRPTSQPATPRAEPRSP
jgi:tetratricopeptide (TPR) repeat protein